MDDPNAHNHLAYPRQPGSVEAFLDEQVAAGTGLSRAVLAMRLERAGVPYPEARRTVDEYCERKGLDIPIAVEIRTSTKDDLIGLGACLVLPLILAAFGGALWLGYRTLVTPAPPPAPGAGDGPFGHTFPVSGWTVGFAALIMGGFVYSLWRGSARSYWWVFRRITPAVVGQNLLVILATGAVAGALVWAFPFLDRSWLYLLPHNNGRATNIGMLPLELRFVGPVFLALFGLCVPSMAHSEEVQYRQGTRDWRHAVGRSLRFGISHSIWAGVPLYVGLALSVGGLWFTCQYFRGGVERSTVHHATYNLIIVAVLALVLIAGGLS